MTILVVDDEKQVHRFLRPMLEADGYKVEPAADGAEARRLAATLRPALILLDLGLPDIDGQDLLVELRALGPAPIIVLSARDRTAEKIRALDAGAADYVEKPFDVAELMARIRAALRLAQPAAETAPQLQVLGPLGIDIARHRVTVDGAPIALTPREFDLLRTLARHPGRVVMHRQLLTEVWGPAHAEDTQYLRVYMGHLRQKLGRAGDRLRTEPGIGYRLEVDAAIPPSSTSAHPGQP